MLIPHEVLNQLPLIVQEKDLRKANIISASRSTLWRWANDPNNPFPPKTEISSGCSVWCREDLIRWAEGFSKRRLK